MYSQGNSERTVHVGNSSLPGAAAVYARDPINKPKSLWYIDIQVLVSWRQKRKIPCSTCPVQSPISLDLCKRFPFTPSLRPFQLKCSLVLFPAAILSSLLFQSTLNGMYIYVDVADPRWVPYKSWLQIIAMKIKVPQCKSRVREDNAVSCSSVLAERRQ